MMDLNMSNAPSDQEITPGKKPRARKGLMAEMEQQENRLYTSPKSPQVLYTPFMPRNHSMCEDSYRVVTSTPQVYIFITYICCALEDG